MDIVTYIKTIQEFELLKEILFNENYLKLFEFISKPTIKIIHDDIIFCQNYESELSSLLKTLTKKKLMNYI